MRKVHMILRKEKGTYILNTLTDLGMIASKPAERQNTKNCPVDRPVVLKVTLTAHQRTKVYDYMPFFLATLDFLDCTNRHASSLKLKSRIASKRRTLANPAACYRSLSEPAGPKCPGECPRECP